MNSNEENNIQNKIDSYLNNTMSTKERLLFEQEMDTNLDLKENVLLQKSISETVFNHNLSHIQDVSKVEALENIKQTLKTEPYQNHIKTIENASSIYKKRKQKKQFLYFGSVAAAILIFVSVIFFPRQKSLETLYTDYSNWDELTSYIEQNESQGTFSKGEVLYKDKKYEDAIHFFEAYTLNKNEELYSASLIYLGASYFKTNNYTKAINTYNTLIQSDSYDSSKGHWYKLLIYLKLKDKDKINTTIQTILNNKNNYKYSTVLEIQKAL